jgi:hypothetical protein
VPNEISCSIEGEHAPIGPCPVDVLPRELGNYFRWPNLAQERLCHFPTRSARQNLNVIYGRIHGGSHWRSLFSTIAMRQNFVAVNP